ncbi:hypothetical protein I0J99_08305 [Sinorhizobium meliloti]|uniref:hypothetical protein n=1 Tax=Rhizobium meliloti TaxID=382 RepID=UPI000FDCBF4C|nr:hypothetical protein [Sinorhizobium meliloti]TWB05025.1 hypothetical protein FB000_103186 [Ensifer sp. SEMIA 134]TWB35971.1 hypothetical protein FB001_10741 [Ensifer sp. SEMIA 135]QPI27225.1 hypothetical protein I0J99_08305 [Sinorhizobium meliloti]RVG07251.1 hypothetical protein CN234_20200 [Sinorhizobium meliloti]RVL25914.1 hypothetical protein CN147_15300 [Sinorhizobium meliloti]
MTIHPADIEDDVADLHRRLVEAERERDEAVKECDRLQRRLAYLTAQVRFAVDEMKVGQIDYARRRLDRRSFP